MCRFRHVKRPQKQRAHTPSKTMTMMESWRLPRVYENKFYNQPTIPELNLFFFGQFISSDNAFAHHLRSRSEKRAFLGNSHSRHTNPGKSCQVLFIWPYNNNTHAERATKQNVLRTFRHSLLPKNLIHTVKKMCVFFFGTIGHCFFFSSIIL